MSEFFSLDVLQDKISTLVKLSSGFAADKERMNQEIDTLRGEVTRLTNELADLRGQLERQQGEKNAVLERVDHLISMIDSIPSGT